jgi:type II secretory pathway component GspD/PulD (secretin)
MHSTGCPLRILAAVLALAAGARGQDTHHEQRKLAFQFREASVDAVLSYVSSVTGWIFIQESAAHGTITVVSDSEVSIPACLDFLNAALRKHSLVIVNPHAPSLPVTGQTLKVLDVSKSLKQGTEIHVGSDPALIPISDQVRTQILPLKAINVVEVQKDLGELLKATMGESGQLAISTYSNALILTGRAEGIRRAASILHAVDVAATAELKLHVVGLKNADATETARVLNEVFKKEGSAMQGGRAASPGRAMPGGPPGMFPGGGDAVDTGGPSGRDLAWDIIRITAETRTNSLIVTATPDNLTTVEDLVARVDAGAAATLRLKHYALRRADATAVAKLLADLFPETGRNAASQGRGNASSAPRPPLIEGDGEAQTSKTGERGGIRAVPDTRSNAVLVMASEPRIVLMDAVVAQLDREVTDVLKVKIYKLKNGDAEKMTAMLQTLFSPSKTLSKNENSPQGQGRSIARLQSSEGTATDDNGSLLPSQEISITADTRTRSVIVKASAETIAAVDDIVKRLDSNPTKEMSTYVIRLRNADAANVASLIQGLLKSSQVGTGGGSLQSSSTQNQAPFSAMQQTNASGQNSSSTRGAGNAPSAGSGQGRLGN